MIASLVILALGAGFAVGAWRRRAGNCARRDHEPRALALADGERFHVCTYVETMWGESVLSLCTHCRRPPPMPLPDDGMPCYR